ncbi:[formate-C-acetyltransferase]-activating enzyme, partial [Salmonella enterica subsp. enterica serovar Virginia]|nr:[formate-C-acetyltransferase]-activating enzyme [Salmonella enterica subsp. enterica serovar Virginia]
NLQVEDGTRTQERLRRGEVVGAVSIQHQALPSCLVDKLGALDMINMNLPRVLENLRLLVSEGITVIPRLPLIPGFTLNAENLQCA